jgi:hypothetical protein
VETRRRAEAGTFVWPARRGRRVLYGRRAEAGDERSAVATPVQPNRRATRG